MIVTSDFLTYVKRHVLKIKAYHKLYLTPTEK